MKHSFSNRKTNKSCKTKPALQLDVHKSDSHHPLAGLQQTIGNRSVQRLVASQQAPAQSWKDRSADDQVTESSAALRTEASGHLKKSKGPTTIQRWGLDDIMDTVRDVAGVGSQIAGPANLIDKAGFLGDGVSGLLGPVGPALGVAAPALALASGVSSLMNEDATTEETVLGGLKTAGGAAGLLGKGLLTAGGGMSALGGGSLFGMSAGSALAGGGAGLGTAAGAGAALSSGGAVALAGAAGYGFGRMLDESVGDVMNLSGASAALDEVRGISRPDGQHGDYTISGMGADIMLAQDQMITNAMRAVGLYDEDRPAYTQTLGWRLGEILPSWMQ